MSGWKHSRRSKTLLSVAVVLVVVGLSSVAVYLFNALPVLGQPDESLVFWLLPFLLLGLAAAGNGMVLAVLWLLLVSTDRSNREGLRHEERESGED